MPLDGDHRDAGACSYLPDLGYTQVRTLPEQGWRLISGHVAAFPSGIKHAVTNALFGLGRALRGCMARHCTDGPRWRTPVSR
jgi:hypothetical protein